MNDDLIYCPKCGSRKHFMRVDKYVRIYELPQDEKVRICVVQCEDCGYPIGAYQEPMYPDNEE